MLARYSEPAGIGERDEAHLEECGRGLDGDRSARPHGSDGARRAYRPTRGARRGQPSEGTRRTTGWCTQAKRSAALLQARPVWATKRRCCPALPVVVWGRRPELRPRGNQEYREHPQSSRMEWCHRLINVIGTCLRPVPRVGDSAARMTTCASGASASSVGASSRWSDSSSSSTIVPCTCAIDRAQRPLS
jgi:hypothetical protein